MKNWVEFAPMLPCTDQETHCLQQFTTSTYALSGAYDLVEQNAISFGHGNRPCSPTGRQQMIHAALCARALSFDDSAIKNWERPHTAAADISVRDMLNLLDGSFELVQVGFFVSTNEKSVCRFISDRIGFAR